MVNVSGIGAITPLGNSWDKTVKSLNNEQSAPEPEEIHGTKTQISRVDKSFPSNKPRFHQLSLESIQDLKDNFSIKNEEPLGLVATSSKGGITSSDSELLHSTLNPAVSAVEIAENFKKVDRVSTPNTACATGLTALIQGARWIEDGRLDQVIVVSSESCFTPFMMAGYNNLGVFCDESGMRPFHPDRSGFALGEGACTVYLTSSEFSKKHNLESLGTVEGWGETSDAHHITSMDEAKSQIDRAIEIALNKSPFTKKNLGLAHAHLTTTQTNDSTEKNIFDDWPGKILLQGIKPAVGHTIGAAGLLEFSATVHAVSNNDPLPIPSLSAEHKPVKTILPENHSSRMISSGVTWNMGFGGHNAAVVIAD